MRDQRHIEYALKQFLPDGWLFEDAIDAAAGDDFMFRVRRGRERARVIRIPRRVLFVGSSQDVIETVMDAIEREFGLGRHATTPVVKPIEVWSPYP